MSDRMNEHQLLDVIRERCQRILGPKLTGIYVHGSIAFGCFRWDCSDAEHPLVLAEKEALIRVLLDLDASAPPKGFEMSVVLRSACSPFADPTPFELHYSNAHRTNYQRNLTSTCQRMQGFDPDLAAHMTVVRKAGVVLCGLPLEEVFAAVPPASYLASIWADIENAPEEIERDPVYFMLNLCRVLAYLQDGQVLSKEQGGEWGASHLPQDSALIHQALCAYRSGTPAPAGPGLCAFAEKMLLRIRQNAEFLNACTESN